MYEYARYKALLQDGPPRPPTWKCGDRPIASTYLYLLGLDRTLAPCKCGPLGRTLQRLRNWGLWLCAGRPPHLIAIVCTGVSFGSYSALPFNWGELIAVSRLFSQLVPVSEKEDWDLFQEYFAWVLKYLLLLAEEDPLAFLFLFLKSIP